MKSRIITTDVPPTIAKLAKHLSSTLDNVVFKGDMVLKAVGLVDTIEVLILSTTSHRLNITYPMDSLITTPSFISNISLFKIHRVINGVDVYIYTRTDKPPTPHLIGIDYELFETGSVDEAMIMREDYLKEKLKFKYYENFHSEETQHRYLKTIYNKHKSFYDSYL